MVVFYGYALLQFTTNEQIGVFGLHCFVFCFSSFKDRY